MWWCLPYDDPETGKHFELEWDECVASQSMHSGCPILSGRRGLIGFNDLASCHPEIATEWHPVKNRRRTPEQTYKAKATPKKAWWICRRCGHEWYAPVKGRTIDGASCPAYTCRKTKMCDI